MTSSAVELEPIKSKRFVPDSWARFEMVLGRLQLSTEYFRIGATHERSKLDDGRERTRSISISTMRGKPTLQVRDVGGNEEVQLSFKADRKVDIVQSVENDRGGYKLTYHQSDKGPVSLRVDFNDGRDALEFESRSLWHLAMAEPLAFDTYMQPCLSRLEPSWQINRSIVAVRGLMNNVVHPSDTKEMEGLIGQLDAEFSSERDAAFLQLRSMGVAAEYQLRQSLKADLSSQQEVSIKRLLSMIQPTGNDTPMRIAVWLSGE
jgi:hypothetical protein